jgi:hypothetical protein
MKKEATHLVLDKHAEVPEMCSPLTGYARPSGMKVG